MSTLNEVLKRSTALPVADREWLHLLIGDWQFIADLSFADLVLWVRGASDWLAVAHVRPNTGQMVFYDDIVGQSSSPALSGMIEGAFSGRRRTVAPTSTRYDDMAVREEAFPVLTSRGDAIAVLSRHTNLSGGRTPSRLELTYRQLADAVLRMIATGEFPSLTAPTGLRRGAPRVGDGVIHLDVDARVSYASPNAISAIHRMGHRFAVMGESLPRIVADLLQRSEHPVDEAVALVVTGRAPWRTEVVSSSAMVSMRAVPLTEQGRRVGALLLLRDVTELRRRERELMTKDATIREIHHRVKNNLQTVAALLRLQSRRLVDDTARGALSEAVRRVGTIALVHETLSQGFDETVDFDEIAQRGLHAVVEVATSDQPITGRLVGSFGRMRAEDATAMAMIISELVQNAAEHGLAGHGGTIEVTATRSVAEGEDRITMTITDDGKGLPPGFRPRLAGLGTQIVTSLVQDLRGRIRWDSSGPGGTRVTLSARLRPLTTAP